MKNLLFGLIAFASLVIFASAQTNEAEKIDEFGDRNCEMILLSSDYLFNKLNENPNSLAYIIFYEGKHLQSLYNKKTKQYESKYLNPRYGEARNKAKAVTFYLTKRRNISRDGLVLIDGGYRKSYGVELWIALQNAEPPKPMPDLERKDIRFRKGKAPKTGDCTQGL